jgi:hypothetical protein
MDLYVKLQGLKYNFRKVQGVFVNILWPEIIEFK